MHSLTTSALLMAGMVAADCSNTLKPSNKMVAANGWSYQLVAKDFTRPRGIHFDDNGGLLVIDSGTGLVHLSLKDEGDTCVSVADKKTLIESKDLNHGIALSKDGKTLYASSAENVFSWTYDSKAGTVGKDNHTIVGNMSNSDHTTRTLLISPKSPNMLIVSRGSKSNVDEEAKDKSSGHSQLRAFDLSKQGDKPYDFLDGHLLGWGLRNSVGVDEHPSSGGIWSVENSVDQLSRKGKDIHEENPAEELNYHGTLGKDDHQGGNYGYPMCLTVWSTKGFPQLGKLNTGKQFPDDDVSKDVTDDMCNSDYVAPRLAFQAHTAPLDLKFNKDGSTAYISFHGSWNRDEPAGYKVASVDFGKDGQPTASDDSMDAAKDILTNPDLSKCPDDCFRPVGLAWDSKGRLWFSSDSTGEIYVLQHSNDNSSEGNSGGNGGGGDNKSAGMSLSPAGAVGLLAAGLAAFMMA